MTPAIYSAGTVLARPKGLFTHVGVVTEWGTIFHNTPERGEHESSFQDFTGGESVIVRAHVVNLRGFLLRLHQRRLFPQPYDAVSNNCEHTVAVLAGDEPASPQLVGWGLLVGTVVVAALFSR